MEPKIFHALAASDAVNEDLGLCPKTIDAEIREQEPGFRKNHFVVKMKVGTSACWRTSGPSRYARGLRCIATDRNKTLLDERVDFCQKFIQVKHCFMGKMIHGLWLVEKDHQTPFLHVELVCPTLDFIHPLGGEVQASRQVQFTPRPFVILFFGWLEIRV